MSAITRALADSQLRFLAVQRLESLERAHAANFRLANSAFFDFFTRDEVIKNLADVLHSRVDLSATAWHDEAQATGTVPPLPTDPAACMGFRFACLRHIKREKIDLRYFVSNLFPGEHLNERLMNWKRLIVHPFAADCRTVSEAIRAQLPDGDWVDLVPLLNAYFDGPFKQDGFGPRAWTDADDRLVEEAEAAEADGNEPARRPTLGEALERLRHEVDALQSIDDATREDLAADVAALQLELRRRVVVRERVDARLDDLSQAADLREACAEVAERLP